MNALPNRLSSYIEHHKLFKKNDRLLVAVSGGIDSMVLLDLLISLQYPVEVLHCNFQLRGLESDEDEHFVQAYCQNHSVICFTRSFDTEEVAKQRGISIQMAARDIRYAWFKDMLIERTATSVLVAHHADDSVETLLINLIRGTGLKGLSGISVQNGPIIRPLLFATRQDIEAYASEKGVDYREDRSNQSTKYLRNRIRHQLIPLIEELNPAFRERALETARILGLHEDLLKDFLEPWSDLLNKSELDEIAIPFKRIMDQAHMDLILFEILPTWGFNATQVNDVIQHIGGESGKMFHSNTHTLFIGRNELRIRKKEILSGESISIPLSNHTLDHPIHLNLSIHDAGLRIDPDSSHAYLDVDKLHDPLTLRRWKLGDRFKPLGMKGFKKLSDFFIDRYIDVADKNKIWLLCSDEQIVWIVGHRIDDRYKVTPETRLILHIQYGSD